MKPLLLCTSSFIKISVLLEFEALESTETSEGVPLPMPTDEEGQGEDQAPEQSSEEIQDQEE
jgi:hypothetical protein